MMNDMMGEEEYYEEDEEYGAEDFSAPKGKKKVPEEEFDFM